MIRTWKVVGRLGASLVVVLAVDEHLRYVRLAIPRRDSTSEGIERAVQMILDNRPVLTLPKAAGNG